MIRNPFACIPDKTCYVLSGDVHNGDMVYDEAFIINVEALGLRRGLFDQWCNCQIV